MPSWKCTTEERGQRYATYLEPWTLAEKLADEIVPLASEVTAASWRQYMQNVLPHAKRLISNFMSACLADNRDAHDNDDSDNEKADTKLSGPVEVAEVLEAAETAMKFTNFEQRHASLVNAKWYSKTT